MAKRQQDTQLTKDAWEEQEQDPRDGGRPERPVDPVKLASSEVMKSRTIKQPKSRFFAAGAAGVAVPQPGFSFPSDAPSNTSSIPAPTSNGSSFTFSGATSATPAPKTSFAGFPTLNGGTPATPVQPSPTKSANPFASLASTTPATPALPSTNPFASLSTTTPAGKPPTGLFGSTTPAGMPAAPKAPLTFGGSTISIPKIDEKSLPSSKAPIFTVKKDAGDTGKAPLFGGVTTASIFGKKSDVEKTKDVQDAEKKPENPFSGALSKPAITGFTPSKPVNTPLFGNVTSTASKGLFGSDAKIGDTKKPEDGLFGSKANGSPAPASGFFTKMADEPPKPLFGSQPVTKAPINSNAVPSSGTGGVGYPTLPSSSTSTSTTFSPTTATNGINATTLIRFDPNVPPPPENFTKEEKEHFEKLFRIRTLNATILKALETADAAGDWRGAFKVYDQLYDQILHGTKRKDESPTNGPESSPKRSRTDEPKTAGSAAAFFGSIVDKNIGSSTTSTPKKDESQPKFIFGGSKASTWTPEKPAPAASSMLFGTSFATPAPVTTNTGKTSPTPPKATSNVFGGAGSNASLPSSGLFSGLRPVLSNEKDKGEEDSLEKPKSEGLLFGAKPMESTAPPPKFSFQAPQNAGTPSKPAGDQTWKPDTPIKFGPSPTSGGIFGSSTIAPPTSNFSFGKPTTSGDTTSPDAPRPFSFTPSLAPPAASRSTSFDGIGSGVTTPGTTGSDAESSAPAPTSGLGNEPSDEVRTEMTDLSGPGPGEENDEVLYTVRVAVYLKEEKGETKKIAVGASRVLKDRTTGVARFLVRTEQGKVALNVRLQKGLAYQTLPQKKVIVIPDWSGTDVKTPKLYTVRMKESASVTELATVIADVMG